MAEEKITSDQLIKLAEELKKQESLEKDAAVPGARLLARLAQLAKAERPIQEIKQVGGLKDYLKALMTGGQKVSRRAGAEIPVSRAELAKVLGLYGGTAAAAGLGTKALTKKSEEKQSVENILKVAFDKGVEDFVAEITKDE